MFNVTDSELLAVSGGGYWARMVQSLCYSFITGKAGLTNAELQQLWNDCAPQ